MHAAQVARLSEILESPSNDRWRLLPGVDPTPQLLEPMRSGLPKQSSLINCQLLTQLTSWEMLLSFLLAQLALPEMLLSFLLAQLTFRRRKPN